MICLETPARTLCLVLVVVCGLSELPLDEKLDILMALLLAKVAKAEK